MAVKWTKTSYPGVRYYEHKTRKHGIQKDRYYAIRYQRDGKRIEEGCGWSSEGWTADRANICLSELKKAHITGEGPTSLKEKRRIKEEKEREREEEEKRATRASITFGEFFIDTYYPVARNSKKETSHKKEMTLFKIWIEPTIGKKTFREIGQTDIERIKKRLLDKKRSPKTIEYVFATIRQTWNMARRYDIVKNDSPTKVVKRPRKDNRRLRFLSHDEAQALLSHLRGKEKETYPQLYAMALLSLHTGMRAGEIFSLTWGDIDLARGIIMIRDPKSTRTRAAYMTGDVHQMFKRFGPGERNELVFKDKRHGGRIKEISHAFRAAVNRLALNEGVTDPRLKVVFHTLRHTYASWLVEGGTDIYTVKELMGHSTLAMTERYSHLGQSTLQEAVKRLDKRLAKEKMKKGEVIDLGKKNKKGN